MKAYLVYITLPSNQVANAMAETLLDERLIACVNILPGMRSLYRWQSDMESADEVVMILKTMEDKLEALKARVEALHPYDTPCILAMPVEYGAERYLQWMETEMR